MACRTDDDGVGPEHRRKTDRHLNDGSRHEALALSTVTGKPTGLPSIVVHRHARTGVAGSRVPPRAHANANASIFKPGASVPLGGGGDGHPRDAGAAAVNVKAVYRPLPAQAGID